MAPAFDTQQTSRSTAYYDLDQATRHIEAGEYGAAIPHLEAAVEKGPTNLMALFNLGACHFELARTANTSEKQEIHLQTSEDAFIRVQSLNPELLMTYLRLGKIAIVKGDLAQAEQYYKSAMKIEPNSAVLHFNLAGVYDEDRRYDLAVQHYQRAIQLDPDFIYAYNNLGLIYESEKKYAEAEKAYRTALKKNPDYNFARLNLGNLYAEKGEYRTAKRLYQEALQIEPENSWAHLYLGNVYFQKDDYENAAREYQSAIERNPSYATAYYLHAVVLHKLNRYDESLISSLKYMNLSPQGRYARDVMALILALKLHQAEAQGTPPASK